MSDNEPLGGAVDAADEPEKKPKTFSELMAKMEGDKAAAKADADDEPLDQGAEESDVNGQQSPTDPDVIPDWVEIPPHFRIPPGKQVYFVKFRAELTDNPSLGDRQCILWPLSSADERAAIKRGKGEPARFVPEQAQQMIRAIDGKISSWQSPLPRDHANAVKFWDDIGAKYRQQLQLLYIRLHSLTDEQNIDFFSQCFHVASSVEV